MKRAGLFIGLSCAVLASGCMLYHRPLVNPEVKIPATVGLDHVKEVVHQALTDYGWTVEDELPGATTAHLEQGQLFARIRVEYNQTQATVRYVDSKNFYHAKSSSGEETIHSRYLVWARNIADRISEDLNPKGPSTPAP